MNLVNTHPGVPVSYAATFYDFLNDKGLPVQAIYAHAGIDPQSLGDPTNKITVEQYIALSKQGLIASNNPGLGLVFGSQLSLTAHNYLGFALQSCQNTRDAIRLSCQYMVTRFPSLKIELIDEGENAVLTVEDWLDEPALHIYNLEVVMAAIYQGTKSLHLMDIMQRPQGQSQKTKFPDNILQIQFEYAQPDHIALYKEVFVGQKLLFNQGQCRILFDKAALDKPFSFSNPGSLKLAESLCLQELKALAANETLSGKIYNLHLNQAVGFLSVDEMAKKLNISSRVLSRELQQEGTSYQKILDNVKKQLAVHYLQTTQLNISEVAYALGFEQPTNFTRAFKKWTGKSPRDFRS